MMELAFLSLDVESLAHRRTRTRSGERERSPKLPAETTLPHQGELITVDYQPV